MYCETMLKMHYILVICFLLPGQYIWSCRPNELVGRRSHPVDPGDEHVHGLYKAPQSVPSVGDQEDRTRNTGNTSVVGGHSESSTFNGALKVHPGSQGPTDDAGFFHVSSPSTTSFSHSRYQVEGEHDPRFNSSGHGLMPMTEVNNPSSLWKQDLVLKIQEHEEEIKQLRKQLAEYSIKAFDQQQQDLVDAASKALSYRQDIIEENIRLSYALQAGMVWVQLRSICDMMAQGTPRRKVLLESKVQGTTEAQALVK
ncbi:hypothetical protein CK203_089052 [Vitis vinifera]|uniref:Uncharacterized protein n=1 Tax=Vitis vinifera TaxID=29760 RepID=A0A438F5P6_VITVI|nr:hypothetical protein CK203_089052 [Vitis vinifera]